jgi:hypothetical protein
VYDAPVANSKRTPKPKLVAPQPVTQVTLQTAFLTDAQLEQLGLDPETASATLADASAVYSKVNETPYVTREQLVSWAQSTWGGEEDTAPADRLNAAVAFLEASGKLAAVNVG